MKHHNRNRKFGRDKNQRIALIKSLVSSLVRDEKIKTTEAKAKEIRPHIERLITHAKKDTVASRRYISTKISTTRLVNKLFKDIAPKYIERNGGYTRIIKLPLRKNDAAKMAQIEFI
jgi:large subunit ribosomal protein L17